MKVIKARACGKLYIAGEYAVVLNKSSIIAPIKKYLNIKIETSEENYLKRNKKDQSFKEIDINSPNKNSVFITETIKWFNKYLDENNINIEKFKITIDSELDDINTKFGFGSSAAVTIALLKCLFKYFKIKYDEMILYKAGVMIQSRISKNSSYGDLACIAFEKTIFYKKFDEDIFILFNKLSIKDVLYTSWQGLIIEPIDFNFTFLIVYTNKSADSFALVSKVLANRNEKVFKDFLNKSEELVYNLVNEPIRIKEIIIELSDNLKTLDNLSQGILITKEMRDIEIIINDFGGSMKFSGAGGGDCVICFFDDFTGLLAARDALEKQGYLSYIYPIKEEVYEP